MTEPQPYTKAELDAMPDDVLARHRFNGTLRGGRPTCGACSQPWGEDGCDAVVMARVVKRLREATEWATVAWMIHQTVVKAWPVGSPEDLRFIGSCSGW